MSEWTDGIEYEGDRVTDADPGITTARIRPGSVEIGIGAFSDCKSLISISMPDVLITIGDNAFYGCERRQQ